MVKSSESAPRTTRARWLQCSNLIMRHHSPSAMFLVEDLDSPRQTVPCGGDGGTLPLGLDPAGSIAPLGANRGTDTNGCASKTCHAVDIGRSIAGGARSQGAFMKAAWKRA